MTPIWGSITRWYGSPSWGCEFIRAVGKNNASPHKTPFLYTHTALTCVYTHTYRYSQSTITIHSQCLPPQPKTCSNLYLHTHTTKHTNTNPYTHTCMPVCPVCTVAVHICAGHTYTLSEHFIRYLIHLFILFLLVFCCCSLIHFVRFRNALLTHYEKITVVTWWCFALPSHSGQLRPVWPFSTDVSHWQGIYFPLNCYSMNVCFPHHSLQTLENVVCENPRGINNYQKHTHPNTINTRCWTETSEKSAH